MAVYRDHALKPSIYAASTSHTSKRQYPRVFQLGQPSECLPTLNTESNN